LNKFYVFVDVFGYLSKILAAILPKHQFMKKFESSSFAIFFIFPSYLSALFHSFAFRLLAPKKFKTIYEGRPTGLPFQIDRPAIWNQTNWIDISLLRASSYDRITLARLQSSMRKQDQEFGPLIDPARPKEPLCTGPRVGRPYNR
jgi:hypothetical protein